MDVHKPKPWHGWREFLKEYGIIVVGVLTALALDQAVEALHWRHQIHIADQAMEQEIGEDDGPEIYQRAIMHPCLQAQLDAIRTAVEAGKSREQVMTLISGYQLEYLTFDSLAKDAAIASEVTVHMPREHLQKWINLYSMIPLLDRTNAKEADDVGRLYALSRTGGALSEGERDRVLEAAEILRQDDAQMFEAVRYTLPEIAHDEIKLDPLRKTSFTNWAKRRYGACIRDLQPGWYTIR
jgi:hypothetical protein